MISHDLLHHGALSDDAEMEDKWQRHVIAAIWIMLAVLVLITAWLLYARGHGFVKRPADPATQVTPWPDLEP